jgi:hypothetical protein
MHNVYLSCGKSHDRCSVKPAAKIEFAGFTEGTKKSKGRVENIYFRDAPAVFSLQYAFFG